MKTNFRLMAASFAAVAMLFASCQKDGENKPGEEIEGKVGTAQLQVPSANQGVTRAAGNDTQAPVDPAESAFGSTVALFIFDNNGKMEFMNQALPINSSGLTDKFQVTSGNKYFYVFFNLATDFDGTSIGMGTTRQAFETKIQTANITLSNDRPTGIAADNSFFIGSLWGVTSAVAGTGTATTPERITLDAGRVVAKSLLKSVVNTAAAGSGLAGTFENPAYVIGSVATKYYRVGQFTTTNGQQLPPPAAGYTVTSAVHTESPTAADGVTQNPLFVKYAWRDNNLNTPFFIVENTTAKDQFDQLYYGNTTYLQFRVKYEPTAAEVWSAADATQQGTLPGNGTFWAAEKDGYTFIFDGDPAPAHPGEYTNIREYTNGLNYYHYPIKDNSEIGIEKQCVILRNHYYEMEVASISGLGNNTDYVDPLEPIKDQKDVEVLVNILPWSKIVQIIEV